MRKFLLAFALTLPLLHAQSLQQGMDKGTQYLLSKQQGNGSWMHHPAITSMICLALFDSPAYQKAATKAAVDKGLDFVVAFAKDDGSIWAEGEKQYPNYSTSVSLISLVRVNRPKDKAIIRNARNYLLGPKSQFSDLSVDDPSYGGVGYGKRLRPDLSNTQWALEALFVSDHLDREPLSQDPEQAKKADLAWERATKFLTRCQNLAETNKSGWVLSDPDNKGGFIYFPGCDENGLPPESKAGEVPLPNGNKGLRSYGSMTYAGLKSMLYAKLKKDDPRVKAAVGWIQRHYTFDENPGTGAQGHFYYLHTVARALAAYGEKTIVDNDGKKHDWRKELQTKILSMQQTDGSWANSKSGRWMESLPELASAYAMLALEATAEVK